MTRSAKRALAAAAASSLAPREAAPARELLFCAAVGRAQRSIGRGASLGAAWAARRARQPSPGGGEALAPAASCPPPAPSFASSWRPRRSGRAARPPRLCLCLACLLLRPPQPRLASARAAGSPRPAAPRRARAPAGGSLGAALLLSCFAQNLRLHSFTLSTASRPCRARERGARAGAPRPSGASLLELSPSPRRAQLRHLCPRRAFTLRAPEASALGAASERAARALAGAPRPPSRSRLASHSSARALAARRVTRERARAPRLARLAAALGGGRRAASRRAAGAAQKRRKARGFGGAAGARWKASPASLLAAAPRKEPLGPAEGRRLCLALGARPAAHGPPPLPWRQRGSKRSRRFSLLRPWLRGSSSVTLLKGLAADFAPRLLKAARCWRQPLARPARARGEGCLALEGAPARRRAAARSAGGRRRGAPRAPPPPPPPREARARPGAWRFSAARARSRRRPRRARRGSPRPRERGGGAGLARARAQSSAGWALTLSTSTFYLPKMAPISRVVQEGHCGHCSKISNLRRLMARNHLDAMSENGGRSRV